jgi:cardiolipin synthase
LVSAADRGVQIQVLVPGPNNDKYVAKLTAERRYEELLEAGIEIYHFAPTMLHAKVTTVDRLVGIVGSANLNSRSLQHDEEVDVVLFDADVIAELDAHTDADLQRCERVTLEDLEAAGHEARTPLRVLAGLVDRFS